MRFRMSGEQIVDDLGRNLVGIVVVVGIVVMTARDAAPRESDLGGRVVHSADVIPGEQPGNDSEKMYQAVRRCLCRIMNARNLGWAICAVIVLAGLDLLGAFLAKEFSIRPRWIMMAGGVLAFALLFVVYVKSLSVSDLWVVTFGWVVLVEIGVLLLDRLRFDTDIPPHKLVLAGVIVLLQVLLMLPPAVVSS